MSGREVAGLTLLAVAALLVAVGCESNEISEPDPPVEEEFSFEGDDGLDGWTVRGIDVEVSPGDVIDWHIETSPARASEGERSVEIFADNRTDACKIWIERAFELEPDTEYSVDIDFDLATADFGDFNLWTMIAGVTTSPPEVAEDLPYNGEITTGPDDVGYQWLDKHYTVHATTGEDGLLYVVLGVWGTWETPRTFYLDNLRLSFTKVVDE